MSNQIIVSVLLPVFNCGKTISRCLQSVLSQSHRNLEIIVVDNNSTDDSAKIIKEFSAWDPRVKYLQERTQGVWAALNCGLRLASGRYVARIDGDDEMRADRIERQLKMFENDNALAVCGSYARQRIQSDEGLTTSNAPLRKPLTNLECRYRAASSTPFLHPTVMFNTAIIQKVGGYRNIAAEDYDLWSRIPTIYSFANIPECLTTIYAHDGQITNKHTFREAHARQAHLIRKANIDTILTDRDLYRKLSLPRRLKLNCLRAKNEIDWILK